MGISTRDELGELHKELASRDIDLWYTHVRRRGPGSPLPEDCIDGVRVFADPDQAVQAFLAAGARSDR